MADAEPAPATQSAEEELQSDAKAVTQDSGAEEQTQVAQDVKAPDAKPPTQNSEQPAEVKKEEQSEQKAASRKRRNSRRNSRRSSVGKKGLGGMDQCQASLEGFYSKDSDITCAMVELFRSGGRSYGVRMLKFGTGGLPEFIETVRADETKYIFGCVKVKATDEDSKREKFLYLEVSSQVKRIIKTKAFGYKQKVHDIFKTKHVTRVCDEDWEKEIVDDKGIESVVKELLKVGASHQPKQYDFGGGIVWDVESMSPVSS